MKVSELVSEAAFEPPGAGNVMSCEWLLLHNCTSAGDDSTPNAEPHALEPKAPGDRCSARQDALHCTCWYDGKACCGCKAPALKSSGALLALGIAEE